MAKVRYFLDDVDAAVSFYIQHLGFELDFNVGPFAMITKDDLTLLISGPKTSAARPMLDGRWSYCQMLCMEASGGDLILPDSVNEFHISDDFTQAAVAL